MAQWFRYYVATLTHRKVQSLPAKLFRHWINVMCVASQADDDGNLPNLDDVAFALRMKPSTAGIILQQLHKCELLDYDNGAYSIHDWGDWQYNSDVSTERVKRFRERRKKQPRNVSETSSDTDTDTDTDTETPPLPPPLGDDASKALELRQAIEVAVAEMLSRQRNRKCSAKVAKDKLRAIVVDETQVHEKRLALIDEINQRHGRWCECDDWTKDGGQFQKGLEFWLTKSTRRWEVEPDLPRHVSTTAGSERDPEMARLFPNPEKYFS